METNFNVSDMMFADMGNMLLPHIMESSDNNIHKQNHQQHPDHSSSSSSSSSDRFLPAWLDNASNSNPQAIQTPSRLVNGVGLDYSPLSIEKVEYLARQLESGIEPYIPSTSMPIGAIGLLDDSNDNSAVYNSTPYDNLLYGNTRSIPADLYGDPSHWRQPSPVKHQNFPAPTLPAPTAPARVPTPATSAANKENADQYRSLSTPKKSVGEGGTDVNTPSTIVLSSNQKQHTILRQNTRLNYNNQTPIRAVKTSSFTKLIAEASDTSPAKGSFISRSVPANVGKAVRSLANGPGATSSAGQNSSVATRPMSFSMSSFQVNLSNSSSVNGRDKSAVSKKKKPRAKRARSASVSRHPQLVDQHHLYSSHPQNLSANTPHNSQRATDTSSTAVYTAPNNQEFQASSTITKSMEVGTAQRHVFSTDSQYSQPQSFSRLSTPNRDQFNSLFLDMGSSDQSYPHGFSNGPIP